MRDAKLSGFEDDSPHPASLLALLLEELVQLVLCPVEPERLERPELRTQLERLFGEEGKVGVQDVLHADLRQ